MHRATRWGITPAKIRGSVSDFSLQISVLQITLYINWTIRTTCIVGRPAAMSVFLCGFFQSHVKRKLDDVEVGWYALTSLAVCSCWWLSCIKSSFSVATRSHGRCLVVATRRSARAEQWLTALERRRGCMGRPSPADAWAASSADRAPAICRRCMCHRKTRQFAFSTVNETICRWVQCHCAMLSEMPTRHRQVRQRTSVDKPRRIDIRGGCDGLRSARVSELSPRRWRRHSIRLQARPGSQRIFTAKSDWGLACEKRPSADKLYNTLWCRYSRRHQLHGYDTTMIK